MEPRSLSITSFKVVEEDEHNREMHTILFDLSDEVYERLQVDGTTFAMTMKTNISEDLPLLVRFDTIVAPKWYGIVTGGTILAILYTFIIFDIIHRTFAAMIASSLSVAALSFTHKRPAVEELIVSIEAETLMMLFSMMILVAIIAKTGIFDYVAVLSFQVNSCLYSKNI